MRPAVIVVLIPLLALACADRSETSVAVAGAGGPATAAPAGQAPPPSDPICSQGWVAEQQSEAARAGSRFAVLSGSSFDEGGRTYAFAILPPDPRTPEVTFLAFSGANGGPPVRIHEEKIETLGPTLLEEEQKPADCTAPDMEPWFGITVVDLDADGTHEIVLESNGEGSCAKCREAVTVYQVSGPKLVTRVEEPCSDLEFSEGQGMVIDSWKYAKNGEIEATRKSFFRPGERR
jgi:hypothetical protein